MFRCRNPVKDIRLVCHRFCDASSHLLFRRVDIDLRPASLERLGIISRHKFFLRGVRAVRVDLSWFAYSDHYAKHESAFVAATMQKVCQYLHINYRTLEVFDNELDDYLRSQLDLSETEIADTLGKIGRTLPVWRAFEEGKLLMRDDDEDDDEASAHVRAAVDAMRECHQEYRKRSDEQHYIQEHGSTVARVVAEAMARTPQAVRLFMTDDMSHIQPFKGRVAPGLVRPEVVEWVPDLKSLIRQLMLATSMTWLQVLHLRQQTE